MVIKYKLGFDGEGDDYAHLISEILEGTESNVIKTDDEIIIFLKGDEENIKSAFAALGEKLPLSLYLSAQNIEEAAQLPLNKQELKKASYLAMYPLKARSLIDESDAGYFNLYSDSAVSISIDEKKVLDKASLEMALKDIASSIAKGKKVLLKNETESFVVSATNGDAVLLTNLREGALAKFCISTDEALSLSTMERPFILKQDAAQKQFKLFFFANDALSLLLSKCVSDNGIDALFVSNKLNADIKVEFFGIKGDAPERKVLFFSGNDRFFLNEQFKADILSVEQNSLFFDLNINDTFGVYALKKEIDAKKIAGATFFTSDVLDSVKKEFDFGQKLIDNFESKFKDTAKALKNLKLKECAAANFFEAVSVLLGSSGGFSSVVAMANDANIAGGVKLDFVLQKEDSGVALNFKKCFTSILSYKLASVENEILAYSVFESAVDFLIVAQDEAKKSFEIQKLLVGGEFLLSKLFVSKLKSKIKNIDMDMALNYLPKNLQSLYEIAK